jgi:chemotaxis protein MotB
MSPQPAVSLTSRELALSPSVTIFSPNSTPMMRPTRLLPFMLPLAILSCVSTGKFKAEQTEAQRNDSLYNSSMLSLKTCQEDNANLSKKNLALKNEADDLNLQLTATKDNIAQLRQQLQTLSALSSSQAESIKKSLDNIGAKDNYIQNLQSAVTRRDSMNLAVLMDLKAFLGGLGDQSVNIKAANGEVTVDLADTLLFSSDSNNYTVTAPGKKVLARLARVMNDQPGIKSIVEGNADSAINPEGVLLDNWDLSVKRATAIVRILQNDYNIAPDRLTASGHGSAIAIAPNDTPEGRTANRRTRIVFRPQTEQLERALERK